MVHKHFYNLGKDIQDRQIRLGEERGDIVTILRIIYYASAKIYMLIERLIQLEIQLTKH